MTLLDPSYSFDTMSVRTILRHREAHTILSPPCTLRKDQWPPNYEDVWVWRAATLAKYDTNPQLLADAKVFYKNNPVAFINHWCDTHDPRNVDTGKPVWMPFIMFERQEQFVHFIIACLEDETPGLVEKCRTMGATWLCVAISVWLWLFYPGVAIGWGSQDAQTVDRIGDPKSIFWKLRELIGRIPAQFKPTRIQPEHLKQFVCYNSTNGSSIVGEVGDSIGRGGRTRIYFKDESAHYGHPELIEASLSENTRVPIDISSVNGLGNLFHRKREAGLDWFPGVEIPKGTTRVFVMDSHDHPEYDAAWHEQKRQYHINQGTLHIYAQEIERNYSASVQGTIIPKEWLDACVDAHLKLGLEITGGKMSALDIGDSEDGDRNAQVIRRGIMLTHAEEWTARDPGVTARKAIGVCAEHKIPELQYDAVGLGSNVKSEANRLKDEGALPKGLTLVPWNAGAKVLHPAERVNPDDPQSPRNKDFFMNLKAQAWWALRLRVYRTYQAVIGIPENAEGLPVRVAHDVDDLFVLDSKMPLLQKVMKELCQATVIKGSRLKLLVDKSPEGTRSPNIADAIVMAYWPMPKMMGDFAMVGIGVPQIFVGGEAFNKP